LTTPIDHSLLASGIIEHFAGKLAEPVAVARALTQIFKELERHSATMVGDTGYRALEQRALYLTRIVAKKDPSLSSIELTRLPDPNWTETVEQLGEQKARRYAAALLAQLLGLLVSFIGEDLTVRLVRRTWTELDVSALTSTRGEGKLHE
jgi:hypothetical protein